MEEEDRDLCKVNSIKRPKLTEEEIAKLRKGDRHLTKNE